MRRNAVHSYVTRDGQVIREVRADQIDESELQHQPPPDDAMERNAAASRRPRNLTVVGGDRPAANHHAGNRGAERYVLDTPGAGAFIVFAFVGLFVVAIVIAGAYNAMGWIASRWDGAAVKTEAVEVSQIPEEPTTHQRPEVVSARSYMVSAMSVDAADAPDEEASALPVMENGRHISDAEATLTHESREPEARPSPQAGIRPSVDYRSSIAEMRTALESRSAEIRRITAELRNISGGDSP